MLGIGLSLGGTVAAGSGELIANSNFATMDLSGWSNVSVGSYTLDASSGACVMVGTNTSNRAWIQQAIPTVVGRSYRLRATRSALVSGGVSISAGTASKDPSLVDATLISAGVDTTFTATTTTTYIGARTQSGGGNATVSRVSLTAA